MSKNEYICDCTAIHHHAVARAQAAMPNATTLSQITGLFKILADPTRCKILWALKNQELCVCDLASLLSMTKSAVSHQLKTMKNAGAVKSRRSGKEIYYSLDDDHVAQLLELAAVHTGHRNSGGSHGF